MYSSTIFLLIVTYLQMLKNKTNFALLSILYYFNYSLLYAYIDPVTTTAIIQGIIAVFATILIYIRTPSKIIKLLRIIFLKIKKKIKKLKNK